MKVVGGEVDVVSGVHLKGLALLLLKWREAAVIASGSCLLSQRRMCCGVVLPQSSICRLETTSVPQFLLRRHVAADPQTPPPSALPS
jgi:hypothetical protein